MLSHMLHLSNWLLIHVKFERLRLIGHCLWQSELVIYLMYTSYADHQAPSDALFALLNEKVPRSIKDNFV